MPERIEATHKLAEHMLGGPVWFHYGEVDPDQPMRESALVSREPITLTQNIWEKTYGEAEAMYTLIVNKIDWQRILIEAAGRHLRASEEDENHRHALFDDVCGDCLRDALLATERSYEVGSSPWE